MIADLEAMIQISGHPVFDYELPDDSGDLGEFVYHYTGWDRLEHLMENGLRLGTLAGMNDPRESKDWLLNAVTLSGVPVNRTALNEAVADYKRKIRIGAFCLDLPSTPDGSQSSRGYARPRMWAQYADNHRGVCLILDRERLGKAIRARYPDDGKCWVQAGKVHYKAAHDDPSWITIQYREDDVSAGVLQSFNAHRDTIFFVKHMDWRDENEYRWVYFDADQAETGDDGRKGHFVNINGSVVGLVLGADYANCHLPLAREFAGHFHLDGSIVRCVWNGLTLHLATFADAGGALVQLKVEPETVDFAIDEFGTRIIRVSSQMGSSWDTQST
jgi:hypothetical protein